MLGAAGEHRRALESVSGSRVPAELIDLVEGVKALPDRGERERVLKTCSALEAHYRGVADVAAAEARKNPHPDRGMKLGALRDYASTLGLQLDKEAAKAARLIDGYMGDVVERDDGVADGDALYDPILDDLENAAPMMMQAMAKLCGAVRPNAKYGAFPNRTKPAAMRKYRRAIVAFANLRRVRSSQDMGGHARFWTTVWSASGAKPELKCETPTRPALAMKRIQTPHFE